MLVGCRPLVLGGKTDCEREREAKRTCCLTWIESSWAFSGVLSKREHVTCTCAWEATLVMRASGAKPHSRYSFFGRSRPWNDRQVTVLGTLVGSSLCRNRTRPEG